MSRALPLIGKFSATDEQYFAERQAFSTELGEQELWSVIDHWPLYAGIVNIARYLAVSDLIRSTLHVPGHVAEFGSWRGANLMFLAKLLRIFDPHGPKMVHCFDSFQGLTEFAPQDGEQGKMTGAFQGSRQELERVVELYHMQDEIVIHEGLIESTLPELLIDRPELSFSFIYCDTDLYESTAVILEETWPRLMPGGLIAFDEWNYEIWPGEGVAAGEFLSTFSDASHFEIFTPPNTRQPSLVIRKLK